MYLLILISDTHILKIEEVVIMLLRVSVENYKSFDHKEELSLISSSKIQTNKNHRVKIKQTNILKNSVVYGANASGKSNLVKAIGFVKNTLMEGLSLNCANDFCRNQKENIHRESVFELQFTVEDKFYAYGFSAILSERKITEEWLYELMQDGSAHNLFIREKDKAPMLGDGVNPTPSERNRFSVYAEDFAGHDTQLFLTEMNRGKKYDNNSKLLFFQKTFYWLVNHIVVLYPNMGISNTDAYYSEESLETISNLIKTFDTGVSEIKTKQITVEEMSKMIPREVLNEILNTLKKQMQMTNLPQLKLTWRFDEGFFNIRMEESSEPEITTLVLKHDQSLFDFNFNEESDGTKRLFDLVDMLMGKEEDVVYVVDELERSLHPKLTEHFLKLFMEAHANDRVQLIFTTHEDTIMDQELFRRDEIWFVERDNVNASDIYSLDRFKERYDKKLSKAYLEGRYGAIPVFKQFTFKKEG